MKATQTLSDLAMLRIAALDKLPKWGFTPLEIAQASRRKKIYSVEVKGVGLVWKDKYISGTGACSADAFTAENALRVATEKKGTVVIHPVAFE